MLPDADPKATYGCPGVQRLFCPAGLPLTVARTARAQITLCAATGSAVMEVVDRTPLTSSIVSATTPAIYGTGHLHVHFYRLGFRDSNGNQTGTTTTSK